MSKKNSSILILSLLFILILAIYSTYAFFVMGNFNVNNTANVNLLTDENNIVFDVLGGQMSLSFNASDLKPNFIGNVVAQNTTTLTVNFQPNTASNIVCTYDIVYEWTSTDKYQAHSPGATGNEFTVQATLTNNSNVSEGLNYIQNENDFANLPWNNSSSLVVKGAQIEGSGSTTSTATWTIISKFYNANADQGALAGKSLSGKFNVSNVKCKVGSNSISLVRYLIDTAPKSGTSAVGSTPWILTSDHANEWRYAGKNPDNYISFNGELWRIIGVMPDTTYCTGSYGTANECNSISTGSLVKIIRNDSLGQFAWDNKQTGVGSSLADYGSSDWSDSQLMLMLNGTNYLKTGYDVNNVQLHTGYSITNNMVSGNGYSFYNSTYSYLDGNGSNIYIPGVASINGYTSTSGSIVKISASYLTKIASVKWYLHQPSPMSPATSFYYYERNYNSTYKLCVDDNLFENRPVYWYGKIGLMYASDYGYASNGGSTYDRDACLGHNMSDWDSGSYKTDCALNSWLLFTGITSTSPGTSGTIQWTISPSPSTGCFSLYNVYQGGSVGSFGAANFSTWNVRPVLYLKSDTIFSGGTGKWNDPYKIE